MRLAGRLNSPKYVVQAEDGDKAVRAVHQLVIEE